MQEPLLLMFYREEYNWFLRQLLLLKAASPDTTENHIGIVYYTPQEVFVDELVFGILEHGVIPSDYYDLEMAAQVYRGYEKILL